MNSSMKTFLTLALVLACTTLVADTKTASTPAVQTPPGILSVAVFDFESKDEAVRDLGPKASTMINAILSIDPQIILVERAELEKVLGEQELSLSGTVSPDTAARVGHLTGAKVLVTGRVFQVGNETVMVAKVIGSETSRVYGEMVKGSGAKQVTELSEELAKKIAATITGKGGTLVAKEKTRGERIATIKQALKSGQLPSILVKVAERHFGQPVIDPAVETEFGKILTECGFTLLDERSPGKPDLEISGEAFSAHGMRKGNLVACKSRIELKVRDASGKILVVDRQTGVAADLAEQTAAKTALQNAAFDLAERIIPKLVK